MAVKKATVDATMAKVEAAKAAAPAKEEVKKAAAPAKKAAPAKPILLDHKKPDREYIDHIIEMLGLKDRRKHLPNQLSGGQQQRAAIARALANRPSLILADEPTGALDSTNGNEVMALLQDSVKKLNQTLVLITHNIDLAREADRIVRITDGKLTEE